MFVWFLLICFIEIFNQEDKRINPNDALIIIYDKQAEFYSERIIINLSVLRLLICHKLGSE